MCEETSHSFRVGGVQRPVFSTNCLPIPPMGMTTNDQPSKTKSRPTSADMAPSLIGPTDRTCDMTGTRSTGGCGGWARSGADWGDGCFERQPCLPPCPLSWWPPSLQYSTTHDLIPTWSKRFVTRIGVLANAVRSCFGWWTTTIV